MYFRCGNKFLEFIRSSAVMVDYQRIKLQEQDNRNAGSRIPRTFEVEVRGSLVNLCITGDIVAVVGIVKTIQVRSAAPRLSRYWQSCTIGPGW
jgi:DNA replicative helicase MCM subunit Mcm2 (Cdc46/Mcm family)